MKFHPVEKNLFFSKNDPNDIRLGDLSRSVQIQGLPRQTKNLCLLGYPDDEGIKLNGGRTGAHQAPDVIRKFFYKMTPPWGHGSKDALCPILDLGNLATSEFELARRHELGKSAIKEILGAGHSFVSFGGGHDYGYPDSAGFVSYFLQKKDRPIVINFDAHMDVRPTEHGLNSGTPFYRLLNEFQSEFDFVELGIQPQCNSPAHVDWARSKGAIVIPYKTGQKYFDQLKSLLAGKTKQPLFISLDIDVFAQGEAPGCSQSWATGLATYEFMQILDWLVQEFKVPGLGIYEVSPPLDQDDRTSKLAALIAYHYWKSLK